MRVFALVLVFFLAFSVFSHALSIEEYLLEGEKPEDITLTPFETSVGNYSLVKIKEKETFLVRNNSFVMDSNEITLALSEYYFKKDYPNDTELDDIKSTVLAFNVSRDLKSKYGLIAESTCKRFLGLDRNTCTDRDSCIYSCLSVYPLCSNILYASGEPFINGLASYGSAIRQLDSNVNNIISNINSLKSIDQPSQLLTANISGLLNSSKASLNQLTYAVNSIKDNRILRDDCPSCYDFCPPTTANTSIVDAAMAKLNALQSRVQPIANIPSVASQIRSTTTQRIDFLTSIRTNAEYESKYNNASAFISNLSEKFAAASAVIDSPEVSTQITFMTGKLFEIRKDIDGKNFSKADFGLKQFYAVGEATRLKIGNTSRLAEEILGVKDNASVMLLRADWELEPQNVLLRNQLKKLELRKADLDSSLSLKASPENASYFIQSYSMISSDSEAIIITKREQAHDYLFDAVLVSARAGVNGVVGIISSVTKLSYEDKKNYGGWVIPAFLTLAWIAVIATLLFLIVSYVLKQRVYRSKRSLVLWAFIFVLLFFASIFAAVSAYFFFQNQTASTSLDGFLSDLNAHSKAALVRDYRYASNQAPITVCSMRIAEKLKSMDKNVTTYSFNNGDCESSVFENNTLRAITRPIKECEEEINGNPLFTVSQNDVNETKFTNFYDLTAVTRGNEDYLNNCDFARVLR